jgi:hypothetical protein
MNYNFIKPLALAISMAAMTAIACQTTTKDVIATENQEATRLAKEADALEEARAYDWQEFKSEFDTGIQANEQRIIALKEKMRTISEKPDNELVENIDKLEQKNKELRNRIANYDQTQTNWESFKREFNHDMDELGKALAGLTLDDKN